MATPDRDAYDELCAYTLTHSDSSFIHQYVVDAYAAQHASASSKPITIAFALFGLYLHLDRGYTGKQVQRAHMRLARTRRPWPDFELPAQRGAVTAADVLAAPGGSERDRAIDAWCASVWEAWRTSHDRVAALLHDLGE